MMVGMNKDKNISSTEIDENSSSNRENKPNIPNDYNVENISEKIFKIIISYTDYIKQVIWRNF